MAEWRDDVNAVEGLEQRVREGADVEIRSNGDGPGEIEGHALTFNDEYRVRNFVEVIEPRAVNSDTDISDVRVLLNHDPSAILARTKSGTAKVKKDSTGLRYTAQLADTDVGHRTATAIRRGDIDASSFGFSVAPGGEEWYQRADGTEVRSIVQIETIFDAGPVVFPANESTSAALRSILRAEPAERSRREWRSRGCPPGYCGIGGECVPVARRQRTRADRRRARYQSARHESAHAVIAYAQGLPIRKVVADDNSGGYMTLRDADPTPEVAVAGSLFGMRSSRSDRDHASRQICAQLRSRHTETLERVKTEAAQARAKKILGKHYDAWRSLASTLARRGEMSGEEVERFLSGQGSFLRTCRPEDHRYV